MFLKLFWVFFCYFLIESNQKHIFSFQPFTSDFASDIFEEDPLQNGFCWCLGPNLEKDSFFIFMKNSKISSNLTLFNP